MWGLEMDSVTVKTNKFRGGERSSNIELFRILSMLMIVAHHYVLNSGLLTLTDQKLTSLDGCQSTYMTQYLML